MVIVVCFISILIFINDGDFVGWQDVIGFLIAVIAVEVEFEIEFVVVFVDLNIIVVIDIAVVGYKVEVVDQLFIYYWLTSHLIYYCIQSFAYVVIKLVLSSISINYSISIFNSIFHLPYLEFLYLPYYQSSYMQHLISSPNP